MFLNSIAFMTSLLRNIILFASEHFPYRTDKQLSSYLIKVTKLYARGCFIVRVILMDMEFEKVAGGLNLL